MIPGVKARLWRWRRWVQAVGAVMLIQIGVITLLVRSVGPTPPRPTFATRLHLVPPDSPNAVAALSTFVDPALFALPSLDGFSGPAWLRYPRLEQSVDDYAESPEWLKLRPAGLAEELFQYLATNTMTPPLLVDEPLPRILRYETSPASEPLAQVSRLRVEGDLTRRGWIGPVELPSWPHSEIVSNTVIRLAVDAAGFTFSSSMVARSGLEPADAYARRIAEQGRFRPLSGNQGRSGEQELTWGTLVFQWHTVPLPLDNAAPLPRQRP